MAKLVVESGSEVACSRVVGSSGRRRCSRCLWRSTIPVELRSAQHLETTSAAPRTSGGGVASGGGTELGPWLGSSSDTGTAVRTSLSAARKPGAGSQRKAEDGVVAVPAPATGVEPAGSAAAGCAEGGAAAHEHSSGIPVLQCGSGSTGISPPQVMLQPLWKSKEESTDKRPSATEPSIVTTDSAQVGPLNTVSRRAAPSCPRSPRKQNLGPSLPHLRSGAWLQGVACARGLPPSGAATRQRGVWTENRRSLAVPAAQTSRRCRFYRSKSGQHRRVPQDAVTELSLSYQGYVLAQRRPEDSEDRRSVTTARWRPLFAFQQPGLTASRGGGRWAARPALAILLRSAAARENLPLLRTHHPLADAFPCGKETPPPCWRGYQPSPCQACAPRKIEKRCYETATYGMAAATCHSDIVLAEFEL